MEIFQEIITKHYKETDSSNTNTCSSLALSVHKDLSTDLTLYTDFDTGIASLTQNYISRQVSSPVTTY